MKKYERLMYLLVILGLVSYISWEFHRFSEHYQALENALDRIAQNCNFIIRHGK